MQKWNPAGWGGKGLTTDTLDTSVWNELRGPPSTGLSRV